MADTTVLNKCITLGPWGYSGRNVWCMYRNGWMYIPEGIIKKIRISHGKCIDSIEFQSECIKGATKRYFFGGRNSQRTDTICFDYPDEYLISISGTFGNGHYGDRLTSLSFHSNQNRYGPYGCDTGSTNSFSYDGKGGVIVGFHGSLYDGFIGSIGLYVMPKSLAAERNSRFEENSRPEKCCRMPKLENPRDIGPWGASGGKAWDDGVFHVVKQVRVQLGDPSEVLFGIQFKYVKGDGKFILSRFHGRTDDVDISEVEVSFDGMQEYLTGISGYYGVNGITSITLHSNKGKHGPYGQECGEGFVCFTSTPSSGKVVGFHGRSGEFLTAIGVHMEYF